MRCNLWNLRSNKIFVCYIYYIYTPPIREGDLSHGTRCQVIDLFIYFVYHPISAEALFWVVYRQFKARTNEQHTLKFDAISSD